MFIFVDGGQDKRTTHKKYLSVYHESKRQVQRKVIITISKGLFAKD